MKIKLLMPLLMGAIMLEASDIKKEEPKEQVWKIQNDPYYKHKKSQFEILAQNEKYKTIMLGDSITAQDSWQKIVALKFGLYYTKYAIGGTKISGTTNQSFVHDDRVNSIDINSDIVSVLGGTNDYGLSVPIGILNP